MPTRHQRKRTPGWRTPVDADGRKALYVGRGTRWGNPSRIVHAPHGIVVVHDNGGTVGVWPTIGSARQFVAEAYRQHLDANPHLVDEARRELAGRDLMCWCPTPEPGQPDHCHGAVLLLVANNYGAPAGAGVCDRCWEWEADQAKHPYCPSCGLDWDRTAPAVTSP